MINKENILETKFLNSAKSRFSVRKFLDKPVEAEKILTCLESARMAPSAENVQPWRFVVLNNGEQIEKFGDEAFSGVYRYSKWATKAPVLICIFAELDFLANRIGKEIQGTQFYLLDIGICGEHIVLQAQELDLGSCWIGWFNAKKGKNALNAPRSWRLAAILALGYPNPTYKGRRTRKPLEELVYFGEYKK